MNAETAILLALCVPPAGAALIALAGRIGPNLREAVTLTTAAGLIACVWSLLPGVYAGERPLLTPETSAKLLATTSLRRGISPLTRTKTDWS